MVLPWATDASERKELGVSERRGPGRTNCVPQVLWPISSFFLFLGLSFVNCEVGVSPLCWRCSFVLKAVLCFCLGFGGGGQCILFSDNDHSHPN